MKRHLTNYIGGPNLRKEFRRQARLLIIITLAFTIAFTWRQTIFDISIDFVKFITNIHNDSTLSILASTAITLISVLLIYLTSRFLADKHESY